MSIAELKKEICKFVEASQDEEKLEFFYESFKLDSETDIWDELTEQQKKNVLEAMKQCERGEVVDNEIVMQKLNEWIAK